jgi:hypothetical protein
MTNSYRVVLPNSQHVWPNRKGEWRVIRYGATRSSRIFSNRSDAMRYARGLVRKARAELYLHRTDGMVERLESYAAA